MQFGTSEFDTYARNLRRLHWLAFLDAQVRERQLNARRTSVESMGSFFDRADEDGALVEQPAHTR